MIIDILFFTLGLYLILFFRKIGRKAIEQRKNLFGRFIDKANFNEKMVKFSQIFFLGVGIIFLLIGVVRLLD